MNDQFKENIFSKIKKEKIEPIPESYFENKKRILWISIGWITLLSSMFFGFLLSDSMEFFSMGGFGWGAMNAFFFPNIFWIMCITICIFIGIRSFRKTPVGYRNSYFMDIFIGVMIIIVGGYVFRWIGFWPKLHSFLIENIPAVSSIIYNEASWNDPDNGKLAGVITEIQNTSFVLRSLDGKLWNVDREKGFVSPSVSWKINEKVRILWKKSGDTLFIAERVLPWFGKWIWNRRGWNGWYWNEREWRMNETR